MLQPKRYGISIPFFGILNIVGDVGMTEVNKKIIELISENKSLKEISWILNITEKQLYVRIKQIINYGYLLSANYLYNSDIRYEIDKKIVDSNNNELSINLPKSKKEFRCLVISDTHIGNIDSDFDLIKIVYEYAAKEGINIILFCGDMIEGVHSSDRRYIHNIGSQIETFIKKYPYDKNIINIGILGNHDYHSLHYDGLDISKRISDMRYDIIPIGYGEGLINVSDDSFLLKHELSVVEETQVNVNPKLVLLGHGHMMKTKVYERFYIGVPTLSYVSPNKKKELLPGFIDMTIHLDKSKFEFIEVHQMIITPKIYESSVSRCRIKTLFNHYEEGKR